MALFLAAGTALSGTTFTEVADANYARVPVTMPPIAQGTATIPTPGPFVAMATTTNTVVAEAIFDAATAGNMLLVWARSPMPLSPTIPLVHLNPLRFDFPDVLYPLSFAATIWPAGSQVGIAEPNQYNRPLMTAVTLCYAGGALSHFVVV